MTHDIEHNRWCGAGEGLGGPNGEKLDETGQRVRLVLGASLRSFLADGLQRKLQGILDDRLAGFDAFKLR